MDALDKEMANRKSEIQGALELLFKTNLTITDWDVPEADDTKAAQMIADLMQEALDTIKADIAGGKYDDY
ncbi:MAG: hypothetical protein AB7S65_00810 [Sulfuricurvum sp.]